MLLISNYLSQLCYRISAWWNILTYHDSKIIAISFNVVDKRAHLFILKRYKFFKFLCHLAFPFLKLEHFLLEILIFDSSKYVHLTFWVFLSWIDSLIFLSIFFIDRPLLFVLEIFETICSYKGSLPDCWINLKLLFSFDREAVVRWSYLCKTSSFSLNLAISASYFIRSSCSRCRIFSSLLFF